MVINVKDFELSVAASLGADPAIITPELIALPMYAPSALAELNKRHSGIDDIPADDERRLDADRAIIAATALKLLPYWKLNYPKAETLPGSKIESFEPDWDSLQLSLEAEIENALEALDPESTTDSKPFYGFRLTGGGRSCT